jgi:ribosomal protein L7/L12
MSAIERPLNEILPNEVKDFIAAEIVAGDMALPSHYPKPHELQALQIGYRSHGLTGEDLVSTAPGGWQPGWLVIAQNYFDDPFFIDITEEASGFPVYYARHGAGRWDPVIAAPSLQRFGQILLALCELKSDDALIQHFVETETDATNALWSQVLEGLKYREEEQEPLEPVYDPKEFEFGDLILTEVGSEKLKVVQIVRRALDVSLPEAMTAAAERDLVVCSGPRGGGHLRRIQELLAASGASTEFRPHVEPIA